MKKLIFFLSLILFGCTQAESKLTIATAANMQYAMKALTKAYEKETGLTSNLVISSSGKLTAQIMAGAPYDIFFSADLDYPDTLADKDLTHGAPEVYAYGKLVLWSTEENKLVSLGLLNKEERIAIGNPSTAPYGKAAEEVIQHFDLQNELKNSLVYGESISQVNQFITTKNVSVGFTSKSSVIANTNYDGNWVQVADSLYTPIAQALVVIKDSANEEEALQFAEFVKSAKGREILNRFGYSTLNN